MTQAEKFRNLAANARNDEHLAENEDSATFFRGEAIRFERLAKLAELGNVEEK